MNPLKRKLANITGLSIAEIDKAFPSEESLVAAYKDTKNLFSKRLGEMPEKNSEPVDTYELTAREKRILREEAKRKAETLKARKKAKKVVLN